MDFERFSEAVAIPELHDLSAAAGVLWASAAAAPNQYPGLGVTHDGVRASFTLRHSPTTYDQLSMYRDDDGVWNVEEQRQRPTLETEGFGLLVRTTATQPLLPGERSTLVTEQSSHHMEGEFTPMSVTTSEQGLDAQGCQRLLGLLRTVRGETELRVSRLQRLRGWLAKSGLARGE